MPPRPHPGRRSAATPPDANTLAWRVHEVLARHVLDPWPLVISTCHRHGFALRTLSAAELAELVHDLAMLAAKFGGPRSGLCARQDLLALLQAEPPQAA